MRSANNSILAGLVLLFLLAHFLLLVGILMRIGARCWRWVLHVTCTTTSRQRDQEATYEANRVQLL